MIVIVFKNLKEQKMCNKANTCLNFLLNIEIILALQQRFKSEVHNVYTEKINKVALSSIYDKRLQTFDTIKSYPYWYNYLKVCKTELLQHLDTK